MLSRRRFMESSNHGNELAPRKTRSKEEPSIHRRLCSCFCSEQSTMTGRFDQGRPHLTLGAAWKTETRPLFSS